MVNASFAYKCLSIVLRIYGFFFKIDWEYGGSNRNCDASKNKLKKQFFEKSPRHLLAL